MTKQRFTTPFGPAQTGTPAIRGIIVSPDHMIM